MSKGTPSMDLYEPLGNQQEVQDPPPLSNVKKKTASPLPPPGSPAAYFQPNPPNRPMMPPKPKGRQCKTGDQSAKPLRDGDDLDLMSDSNTGGWQKPSDGPGKLFRRQKTTKNAKKNSKNKRKAAGQRSLASSGSRASGMSRMWKGWPIWQIVVLAVLGAFSVVFIFMTLFAALHVFGAMSVIKALTPECSKS